MNQTTTPAWSPMVSGPDDDFANFLEFTDLQLNFPTFDGTQNDGGMQQDAVVGLDTAMENVGEMMDLKEGQPQQQMEQHDVQQQPSSIDMMESLHSSTDSLLAMDMQVELFQQQSQQQQQQQQQQQMQGQHYQRHNMVPPTPNSIEMHGGKAHYYPHMDPQAQAMYERYRRHPKEQMTFTPLVSPAVTPLDTQFRMPEFTIPGEYFSPLTSPALEAQNPAAHRSGYGAVLTADAPEMTSPVDMNIDLGTAIGTQSPNLIRKPRRKASTTSTKNPARAVRQSPAMKPQTRRRQASSTTIPPKEVAEIIEEARRSKQNGGTSQTNPGKLPLPYSQDSSEAESVSPESLSEALMPPPATPRPGSAGRSPRLTGKLNGSKSAPLLAMSSEPATPASLMKIRKQASKALNRQHSSSNLREQALLAENEMEQIMEDIVLPEPARIAKPDLPPIITTGVNQDDQTTPTLSARKISYFGPLSAPPTATSSVFPSPQLASSPSPGATMSSKRTDLKPLGRGSKKRNSTTSVHVSPALRPKISPSIKPLLPEGASVSSETSALLLASKSNYQNILEGTHLPGVSYPEALSTNLTSKRTSHKIAEQGRRNRINNALQEIAALLPSSSSSSASVPSTSNGAGSSRGDGSGSSGPDSHGGNLTAGASAAQQSNSKASTVEMAIDYIKALQRELRDTKGRLEEVERRLEEGGKAGGDGGGGEKGDGNGDGDGDGGGNGGGSGGAGESGAEGEVGVK